MKRLPIIFFTALLISSCVKDRTFPAQTVVVPPNSNLIHYWNFNTSADTIPTISIVPGALLSFDFLTVNDTTGYDDAYTYTTLPATNINQQNGDPLGNALRVRNPCSDFIITAPTTGYKNIIVSYAEAKSSNGALTNTVSYTTDGTNYITYPGASATYTVQVDPVYTLETFDFTSITGANNNPNFKVKITFSGGNAATSGNDRFDNLTVEGISISGGSNAVPVISSSAILNGIAGTALTGYTITASNTPTSYAITGMPVPGLSLNTTTGAITGTPTAAGAYIDTIKATNASGTGIQVLTVTIVAANNLVPVISSGTTASGTVGTTFAGYTITASNTPTSYDITGMPVPGLSLNKTTGVITGTPTANGVYIDTIKATNASGTGKQVLTITIAAPAVPVAIDYWNFENNATLTTLIAPTTGNGTLITDFTGAGYYDSVAVAPSQPGVADGDALRVRNPSVDLIIAAPTTGYKNIVVSYAVDISSTTSGATTDSVYYTTDGTHYINTGLSPVTYNPPVDPSSSGGTGFAIMSFDLSSISGVSNNANFRFKVAFFNGNTGTKGNTRFDNITVTGTAQ